jgi:hypothetical protein
MKRYVGRARGTLVVNAGTGRLESGSAARYIITAFARKQAPEILLNLSRLLIHPIKVLEFRDETGKKKKKVYGRPHRRWGTKTRCPWQTSSETGTESGWP